MNDLFWFTILLFIVAAVLRSDLFFYLLYVVVGMQVFARLWLRQSARRFLGSRPEPAARQAVLAALADSDVAVQRTALAALSAHPDGAGALAVANLLEGTHHWSLRRQAAQALEQMGQAAASEQVVELLQRAALEDRYALVRDAAARALYAVRPPAAAQVLERLRQGDPESKVRATAQELRDRKP